MHPNCPNDTREIARRKKYDYDHGVGILYWEEHCNDEVVALPKGEIEEGHCTRIGNKYYVARSPADERRNLSKDLAYNFDIEVECRRLGLEEFLYD